MTLDLTVDLARPAPSTPVPEASGPGKAQIMATALHDAGVKAIVSASDNGLLIRVHDRHAPRLLELLAPSFSPVGDRGLDELRELAETVADQWVCFDSGDLCSHHDPHPGCRYVDRFPPTSRASADRSDLESILDDLRSGKHLDAENTLERLLAAADREEPT